MRFKPVFVGLMFFAVGLAEALAFRVSQMERPRAQMRMDSEPIFSPVTVRYVEDAFGAHVEVYDVRGPRPERLLLQHVWKYVD